MLKAPVLFIVFNRPYETREVFSAIRAARPERLYIAADAPRLNNDTDDKQCKEVRDIVSFIDWDCEVKRLYQAFNLGSNIGPRTAFEWFFKHETEGIILEDDCLPHQDFFEFATEMLDKYRSDKRIISINGSNLGYSLKNGDSYFFSRFMNMWGWATWANRANEIDYSLAQWKQIRYPLLFLYSHLQQNFLDTDINWYKYWKDKFDRSVDVENVTWWDWQWIFNQLSKKQLSVVPAVNLVQNIGFNDNATHTHRSDNPAANIRTSSIIKPYRHPRSLKVDFVYEEEYVKWVWCYHKRLPAMFYIKQFISSFAKI